MKLKCYMISAIFPVLSLVMFSSLVKAEPSEAIEVSVYTFSLHHEYMVTDGFDFCGLCDSATNALTETNEGWEPENEKEVNTSDIQVGAYIGLKAINPLIVKEKNDETPIDSNTNEPNIDEYNHLMRETATSMASIDVEADGVPIKVDYYVRSGRFTHNSEPSKVFGGTNQVMSLGVQTTGLLDISYETPTGTVTETFPDVNLEASVFRISALDGLMMLSPRAGPKYRKAKLGANVTRGAKFLMDNHEVIMDYVDAIEIHDMQLSIDEDN